MSSNEDTDVESVIVPVTDCPLSQADFAQLHTIVNPCAETDNQGIDHYLQTVRFVQSKIH